MDLFADQDVKLQRTSSDLISTFETSVRRYLWKTASRAEAKEQKLRLRESVGVLHLRNLVDLLEPFQEWPQLLDPHLTRLLPPVVEAFLGHIEPFIGVTKHRNHTPSKVVSSRFAACKILYTLCKIRGQKIISRFLSNEPKWLEPMLLAFGRWDALATTNDESMTQPTERLTWEEKYIILLWLSHLLLTPFDLASISSVGLPLNPEERIQKLDIPESLPWSAKYLVFLGLRYIGSASRERESAQLLLVRLSVRPDMYQAGLMNSLIRWTVSYLCIDLQPYPHPSIYSCVGLLSYLTNVLTSAGHAIAAQFVHSAYRVAQDLVSGDSEFYANVRSSALARKALIKLYRTLTCLELDLTSQSTSFLLQNASVVLEDVIEYLLNSLAAKDTPVRFAASKAISAIAQKMEQDLARDVVEAVLDSLRDDLGPENLGAADANVDLGKVPTTAPASRRVFEEIDFMIANPLRWHGLILTLANLLFHRSPPPDQLPDILKFLCLALQFEQRSSTRNAIGTNVRDAACFGIWALSRKYSTLELLAVDVRSIQATRQFNSAVSVPQILAKELVTTACLDPTGNIRRGASAALQELVGRHPDTVVVGISVILVVDYHAVALRSKAIMEVGISAAKLDVSYWYALLSGLLGWRGLGSLDARSRKAAAAAVGILSTVEREGLLPTSVLLDSIIMAMARLQVRQVEQKHGMLLSLSAIIDGTTSSLLLRDERRVTDTDGKSANFDTTVLSRALHALNMVKDQEFKSPSLHPELIAEASCNLISSIARLLGLALDKQLQEYLASEQDTVSRILIRSSEILALALTRSEEAVIVASTTAVQRLFVLLERQKQNELVETWISCVRPNDATKANVSSHEIGYLHALGASYRFIGCDGQRLSHNNDKEQQEIIRTLLQCASPSNAIEVRGAALRSLTNGVLTCHAFNEEIVDVLRTCLDDYTVDSRGDIGSLLRLEAIDAVEVSCRYNHISGLSKDSLTEQALLSRVARLSAEKLDKVRLRAIGCLFQAWNQSHPTLVSKFAIVDSNVVCSYEYFQAVLRLLISEEIAWAHVTILEGFVTSAGSGSQSVLEAARHALINFVETVTAEPGLHSFTLIKLWKTLTKMLQSHQKDDRVTIPTLEVLAFLFDSRIETLTDNDNFDWLSLFIVVQAVHFRSGNIPKLEASIKVYSGLASIPATRDAVLFRMTKMLLHPFPRVRQAVAESLHVLFDLEGRNEGICKRIAMEDWSLPAKGLKPTAEYINSQIVLIP